jgi:hypothetical protein
MGVAYKEGQWRTHYVYVPKQTPDHLLEEAGRKYIIPRLGTHIVAGCWLHNTMDDEDQLEHNY